MAILIQPVFLHNIADFRHIFRVSCVSTVLDDRDRSPVILRIRQAGITLLTAILCSEKICGVVPD